MLSRRLLTLILTLSACERGPSTAADAASSRDAAPADPDAGTPDQGMSPDASTLAMASTEVDIGAVPEGQIITIKWRGKPVFISHRTKKEIEEAQNVDLAALKDPQTDASRVKKPEWLIVIGVCTHLGCIPLGHQGEYGGWFCPCHGSVYDTSGRIRKGPAPLNLLVPEYSFLSDTKVKIG